MLIELVIALHRALDLIVLQEQPRGTSVFGQYERYPP